MPEDLSIESDLQKAILLHQRDELKNFFQSIDEEDAFEITDDEMKVAVVNAGRSILKDQLTELDRSDQRKNSFKLLIRYAMAAAVIGIIVGGVYLLFFDIENAAEESKSIAYNEEVEKKLESRNYHREILFIKGTGSEHEGVSLQSVTLTMNFLQSQINRCSNLISIEGQDSAAVDGRQFLRARQQLDSLNAIVNTYTYSEKSSKLVLNLLQQIEITEIISLDEGDLSKIYIHSSGRYYTVEETEIPKRLIEISDNGLLERLRAVENR